MIKPPLTGLAVVLLSACGGATSPDPQAMGTAYFKMDQVSCVYSGAKSVTFYIETVDMGTQSLTAGATSTGYLTKASATYPKPGGPVVQARIANYTTTGGALWTLRTNINVPSNGTVTHTFVC